jgi:DNA-binding MarR family transcriptional regulator
MTKLMRGLEDSGLVTRISPRSDLRSVELTLTREGEALAAKAKARMKGHGDRATPMLSSDERKLLIGLLKKVTGRD